MEVVVVVMVVVVAVVMVVVMVVVVEMVSPHHKCISDLEMTKYVCETELGSFSAKSD